MKVRIESERIRGQIDARTLAIIIAVIIVLGAAYWFFIRGERAPEPIPEPLPEPAAPLEKVAPAESAEERGDEARAFIASLKSGPDGIDYAEAYRRAREFQSSGQLADAQLLYFLAARGGHAPAAFDLATMHDPLHFSAAQGLMDEPDAFQAYRWYSEAAKAGHDLAGERLADLRAWAEKAAGTGDREAEQLLLQWEVSTSDL